MDLECQPKKKHSGSSAKLESRLLNFLRYDNHVIANQGRRIRNGNVAKCQEVQAEGPVHRATVQWNPEVRKNPSDLAQKNAAAEEQRVFA
jgi:hypothetical protein